eukprot:12630380-Alexandrium_andersonii.AAC.1
MCIRDRSWAGSSPWGVSLATLPAPTSCSPSGERRRAPAALHYEPRDSYVFALPNFSGQGSLFEDTVRGGRMRPDTVEKSSGRR